MTRFGSAALMYAAVQLVSAQANAALISSTTISGGNINYQATETSTEHFQAGDFITLYDAGANPINLTGDLGNASLFTISTNLTDTPAPGVLITDDPTIRNLRFAYIGASSLSDTFLGTFSLSDPSGTFRFVSTDGLTHIAAGTKRETGTDVAPILPAVRSVPEPGSLSLIGLAAIGLVFGRRAAGRHRRSNGSA